ncbi:MAG: hypothetical protein WBD56_14730 [Anaerolineales bacterium]
MDYRWLRSLQSSKDCWLLESTHGFKTFAPKRTSRIVSAILAYVGGKQLNSISLMQVTLGVPVGHWEAKACVTSQMLCYKAT